MNIQFLPVRKHIAQILRNFVGKDKRFGGTCYLCHQGILKDGGFTTQKPT
jgi:hypothetical protein